MPKNTDRFDIEDDLELLEDDEYADYDEYIPEEMISAMSSLLSQSLDVAKLIIENRVRNSERMSDEDIYQIHMDSFTHMSNIISRGE